MTRPVIAAGMLLCFVTGVRGQAGGWQTLALESGTIDEYDLVSRYAPDILQWVHDNPALEFQDFITSVGFNEAGRPVSEWSGVGKWDAAESHETLLTPALYGGLVAVTENQFYLVYYYYHPRDYAGFLGPVIHFLARIVGQAAYHENDLEGGMIVVDRDTGRPIHAMALAHNKFDERHLCARRLSGRCRLFVEVGTTFLFAEPEGHGAYLVDPIETRDARRLERKRERFIRYVPPRAGTTSTELAFGLPTTVAATQLDATPWPNVVPTTTYELLPLWQLFVSMFLPSGDALDPETELFGKPMPQGKLKFPGYPSPESGLYAAMRGEHGGTNKAHFPWGQHGQWYRFADPVPAVLNLEDTGPRTDARNSHAAFHDSISCDYEFNPYLESILLTTLADPGVAPGFPIDRDPEWRARDCGRWSPGS